MENKNRICIIGGGFGGLFAALNMAGEERLTLISGEDHFLFTPMLYEYLSGEVEVSLGTERAAVEVDGYVVAGALGREARFAMYAARLPTWHQRFRVAPRWILGASDPQPL